MKQYVIYFGNLFCWNENEEKAVQKGFTVYVDKSRATKELRQAEVYMLKRGDILQACYTPQVRQVKCLHPLEFVTEAKVCQLKIEGLDNQMNLFA